MTKTAAYMRFGKKLADVTQQQLFVLLLNFYSQRDDTHLATSIKMNF
jgi:hypothetical protein